MPDLNTMYELYDPCTLMFFFRNKVRSKATLMLHYRQKACRCGLMMLRCQLSSCSPCGERQLPPRDWASFGLTPRQVIVHCIC